MPTPHLPTLDKEACTVQLNAAEQKIVRKRFLSRFKVAPSEVPHEDLELYAAMAARLYKRQLPSLAQRIEQVCTDHENRHVAPLVIRGTKLGYATVNAVTSDAKDFTDDDIRDYGMRDRYDSEVLRKHADRLKTPDSAREAHHILGLAILSLLGVKFSHMYANADTATKHTEITVEQHNHQEYYSVVVGLGNASGVNTHIYGYVGEDGHSPVYEGAAPALSTEVKRGTILIIPPYLEHHIDETDSESFGKRRKRRVRQTFAYMASSNAPCQTFSDAELDEAEKRFLSPDKHQTQER